VAEEIHGDRSQSQREAALSKFREVRVMKEHPPPFLLSLPPCGLLAE